MKIVMKFGGTSVATGENIRHVVELVSKNTKKDRVAVVVSALAGVTNSLIEVAEQAKKSDEKHIEDFTKQLLRKHSEAISCAIGNKEIQKEVTKYISECNYPTSLICIKEGQVIGVGSPFGTDYPFNYRANVGSTLKPFTYTFLRANGFYKDHLFSTSSAPHFPESRLVFALFSNSPGWPIRIH